MRSATKLSPALQWLGVVVVLAAKSAGVCAQDPPALRSTVNLVNVSFTARDPHGNLLKALTADQVAIFEDGSEQKIAHFSRSSELALTLGLIVDASNSQEHFSKKHEKDVEAFVRDVIGPKDRVFLLCFGNHLRLVNDYTQSGGELVEHLKEYEKKADAFPEIGPIEHREGGTAFYDSIFHAVEEKLGSPEGRRALLIFSDGEDNSSAHDMMSTIEAAQAANVLVYTIRYTEMMKHGELSARNKYGIRVMDRLAKETGAGSFDASRTKPDEYFAEIAEELRTMYEIGYYPSNPMKDERFRKIEIRPKQDGIKVRAKSGYFAR
jgi:Ca-activated chloride channel family protein